MESDCSTVIWGLSKSGDYTQNQSVMSEVAMLQQVCGAGAQLWGSWTRLLTGLSFPLVSGWGTAQVFTVSSVLGSTEGERLAGRATFLTPRHFAEYAKSDAEDILKNLTVFNRGPDEL